MTPAIEIVPNSGPADTEISVSGTGFGTGESGINVTYDAVVVAGPATATPDGIWGPLVFSAPAGASNVFHTVDAFGDTTSRFEVPNQIFTIEGTILVTPSTGTVGTLVTAQGGGFGANETGIELTFDGTSVGSGITAGPDLAVAGNVSFVPGVFTGDDDNGHGHGTHVAGIAGALDNAIGVVGVAPESSLFAVKVLDVNGSGTWGQVIQGIEWAADNGMAVANMSLGASSAPSAVGAAVNAAFARGVLLVAAAGNSGNVFGIGR